MERKKALALASAATFVLGSTVVAVAWVSGASFLGFGGAATHRGASLGPGPSGGSPIPGVVRKTRNVYDRYVVDLGGADDAGSSAGAPAASPGVAATPGFTGTTTPPEGLPASASPAPRPPTRPPGEFEPPDTETPTPTPTPTTKPGVPTPTTTPAQSTTTIPTTTTTRPPGVPADWPNNKPIPPVPPNCRQPQLEDNGVWNCDH
jgi:hypothetical protein